MALTFPEPPVIRSTRLCPVKFREASPHSVPPSRVLSGELWWGNRLLLVRRTDRRPFFYYTRWAEECVRSAWLGRSKSAETTSVTAMHLAEILQQAELPDGVVNIVTGAGETG